MAGAPPDPMLPVACRVARVRQAARDAGLAEQCRNPFQSIIVRSLEMLYACDEALRIIESYRPPERPYVEAQPRASTGYGCTEAPGASCFTATR